MNTSFDEIVGEPMEKMKICFPDIDMDHMFGKKFFDEIFPPFEEPKLWHIVKKKRGYDDIYAVLTSYEHKSDAMKLATDLNSTCFKNDTEFYMDVDNINFHYSVNIDIDRSANNIPYIADEEIKDLMRIYFSEFERQMVNFCKGEPYKSYAKNIVYAKLSALKQFCESYSWELGSIYKKIRKEHFGYYFGDVVFYYKSQDRG